MGTKAVFSALNSAHRSRMQSEITSLDSAVMAYKDKFGDYPPSYIDNTDPNSVAIVARHLAKAFPRCNPTTEMMYIPPQMSPAEAIVFWLTSISKDPTQPLSSSSPDRQSFFDFDRANTRLVALNSRTAVDWQPYPDTATQQPALPAGWSTQMVSSTPKLVYTTAQYVPANGNGTPYVYFSASCYLFHAIGASPPKPVPYLWEPWDTNVNGKLDAGTGSPTPNDFFADSSGNLTSQSITTYQKLCAKPKSFQIIAAGLDGDYGTANVSTAVPVSGVKYNGNSTKVNYKSYPSGIGYDTGGADNDNVTNFSEKQLGDAIP
jgi:hypothetical protein